MKLSSLKKNFIYNIMYQLLLMILPLILSPYISRVLGEEGLGIYSYTYSIASGIAVFGMLGVGNYGNRCISAVQTDRKKRSVEFWNIWFWQVILTIAVVFLYLGYLVFLCRPEYCFVSAIEIFVILNSLLDINWFFFGMEKFKLTVSRNMIIKVLCVVCVLLLVKDTEDVWIYTAIMTAGTVVSNSILWGFLRQYVDAPDIKWEKARKHFKSLLILFIPVIAVSVYQKMDKIMLGSLSTIGQSGYYENVEKLINMPKGMITALGTVMLPRMSLLIAKSETKLVKQYIKISMEFVMFSSSAIAFGLAAVSDDFAPAFFGERFASIGPLIQTMAITIVFVSCANVVRTQYLIPNHKDKIYICSVWLGAVVNLVINAVLIPKHGAFGAVVGTVAAEGSVMFYQAYCVRRELDFGGYLKNGIYYFVAGFVMYLAVRGFSERLSGELGKIALLVGEVLTGICCYVLLCMPYILMMHKRKQILKGQEE